MNAKDAILYLYDKGLLNIDAIMKNKDSIMQELDNATENKPKYDPCRLFKKGDKVKRRTVDGRTDIDIVDNGVLTVNSDEDARGNVRVQEPSGRSIVTKSVFLELVTPVEELEPYSTEESCGGANLHCFILKRGEKHLSYYLYKSGNANHFYTREEAKSAAESERDRLNAEWRKEQNNV